MRGSGEQQELLSNSITHEVGGSEYENNIAVTFNRFIYEDQVGDLIEMIDYIAND